MKLVILCVSQEKAETESRTCAWQQPRTKQTLSKEQQREDGGE